MHRTDATDFDPDIGTGDRGFKESPSGSETFVDANFMNIVQEEIVQTILGSFNGSIRASGNADAAATWASQLLPAIKELTKQFGIWADATKFGFVTSPVSADDNINALNAAFASSPYVFIPAGAYAMTATGGVKINIPDGGILAGEGFATTLLFSTTKDIFNIANINCTITDMFLNGQSLPGDIFTPNFSVNKTFTLQRCKVDQINQDSIIDITSTTGNKGLINIIDCDFLVTTVTGKVINGTTSAQSRIFASGNHFTDADIFLGGGTLSNRLFINNNFLGGDINLEQGFNVVFENNTLDIDAYFFDNTDGSIFRNNYLGTSKANTKNNNFNGNPSRVFWMGNRDITGSIQAANETIIAVKVTGDWSAGNETVGTGLITLGITPNIYDAVVTEMANNPTYTKQTIYNIATGEFAVGGNNGERLIINCQILFDEPTSSDFDVFLGSGATARELIFQKTSFETNKTCCSLRMEAQIIPSLIRIMVNNNTGGSITILKQGAISTLKSFISFEGF